MKQSRPVIITGSMDHWPALTNNDWYVCTWYYVISIATNRSDLDYLKRMAGLRTVPIEVGKTYLEPGWSQKLMTLNTFIDNYVQNPEAAEKTGYLAQTQLFEQIPELQRGI